MSDQPLNAWDTLQKDGLDQELAESKQHLIAWMQGQMSSAITTIFNVWAERDYSPDVRLRLDMAWFAILEPIIGKFIDALMMFEVGIMPATIDELPLMRQWVDAILNNQRFHTTTFRADTIRDIGWMIVGQPLNKAYTVERLQADLIARVPVVLNKIQSDIEDVGTQWKIFEVTAKAWLALQQEQA